MKIGIANDHSAVDMKKQIVEYLVEQGYEVINYGTDSYESCNYPEYGEKIAHAVADGEVELGIAICGTGIGISIACNKVKGIRCAKVDTLEEAIATRVDNDSNIIAFGENMPLEKALELIKTFIKTNASNEEKHVRRRQKISEYEDR